MTYKNRQIALDAAVSREVTGMVIIAPIQSPEPVSERVVRLLELPEDVHPYFVGTQAHPEMSSRPLRPQPFFVGLAKAALAFSELKKATPASV